MMFTYLVFFSVGGCALLFAYWSGKHPGLAGVAYGIASLVCVGVMFGMAAAGVLS